MLSINSCSQSPEVKIKESAELALMETMQEPEGFQIISVKNIKHLSKSDTLNEYADSLFVKRAEPEREIYESVITLCHTVRSKINKITNEDSSAEAKEFLSIMKKDLEEYLIWKRNDSLSYYKSLSKINDIRIHAKLQYNKRKMIGYSADLRLHVKSKKGGFDYKDIRILADNDYNYRRIR
jgi:hypothetical protein